MAFVILEAAICRQGLTLFARQITNFEYAPQIFPQGATDGPIVRQLLR